MTLSARSSMASATTGFRAANLRNRRTRLFNLLSSAGGNESESGLAELPGDVAESLTESIRDFLLELREVRRDKSERRNGNNIRRLRRSEQ